MVNQSYDGGEYNEEDDDGMGGKLTLLNTIKLPKNLKLLSNRLPKS